MGLRWARRVWGDEDRTLLRLPFAGGLVGDRGLGLEEDDVPFWGAAALCDWTGEFFLCLRFPRFSGPGLGGFGVVGGDTLLAVLDAVGLA